MIFSPGLSVLRVETYADGLDLVNSSKPYGNGTAILTTNNGRAARRFQNEVEVGVIGISEPIPVPMACYSFGGWKNNLFGDTHAHGIESIQFFTPRQGRHLPLARPQPRRPKLRRPQND